MEERLVEALGHHVQDSVNRALIQALKPFTQPLTNFGRREFLGEGSQKTRLPAGESMEVSGLSLQQSGGSSFEEILAQMAAPVLRNHIYGSFLPQESPNTFLKASLSQAGLQEQSSSKSESDDSHAAPVPCKKKHKSHDVIPEAPTPAGRNLLFSAEDIVHPHSTEWVPTAEVAHYVQDRLHKSFEKEVGNTLGSECPQPSSIGKVADTPELDPSMATFLRKFAKDPKKGLDRAWYGCQGKLLDLSGPLMKILDLAIQFKETNSPLDPEDVLEWEQRAICLLGNAGAPS
ncbi:hypothetical protein NDU88_002456 [Pleurodeles waltl]|uniref:Uncharacterized protein n=1 Tax=Pleurodeles waltl TaxID=8319 RepID=A0AAV7SAI7_PLEWA|nr:hypothetical protein NDU88_002456 [Pleurodeles waltl]